MIRKLIFDTVFNYFLHIQINTLNLPYTDHLPRPRKASPVSKLLRKLFEKKTARRFFGANLAAAMMLAPLLGSFELQHTYEPAINIPDTYLQTTPELEESVITTTEREYILPVERLRYVGQYYKSGHAALDLNSYVGDDVYAFTGGQVAHVESGLFGLGKYVVLDHGLGLISVYAHLRSFEIEVGDVVKTGDKIGEVGMTGYTTGPHLHFEIHDNGVAINPLTYLEIK